MKKILSVLLAMFLLVGLLAACTETPAAEDTTTPPIETETPEPTPPTEIETDPPETVEPETEAPAPDPNPTQSVSQAPVGLRSLLARNLGEVRHLLGNEISSEPGAMWDANYSFDTGLLIGIADDTVYSILINYGQANSRTAYHLDGIDGTSTYDDVVAMFGNQPYSTREESVEIWGENVGSYGYWLGEHDFAWFSFDVNGNVVGISLFVAGF